MKQTDIYQLLAFLLNYPNEDMKHTLPEIKELLQSVEDEEIRQKLDTFVSEIDKLSLDEWIHSYVEQFDFGKKTNLYVTYLKMGEQKERGLELLKLKKFYQAAGFSVTDKELPDYVPLMLEFSANVSTEIRKELWKVHERAIWEIRDKLLSINSFYIPVFDVIIQLLKKDGVEHQALAEKQPPTPNLEDQAILASMRDQLIKNQLG
ncbi:Nitrate reductase-like protein NarX [Paraliobacillus sp. PM-2]|uniref:nitrate reductase molybdenum cofactor assembly chaperone n=1 Tax=Paraliobacillus sp. PM-2 TaxID=1462524 RepID=UPI00061C6E2D|nr:nitrate reductase molybdenum cofactor assembly chaperone [Paraliobacillus sp. PM-2]CQR46559.1 Nitrate reductase-like protein NarX [Paraliobacillus sp. PM-2]